MQELLLLALAKKKKRERERERERERVVVQTTIGSLQKIVVYKVCRFLVVACSNNSLGDCVLGECELRNSTYVCSNVPSCE